MAEKLVTAEQWQRLSPSEHNVVSVANLSCSIHAGMDIWGRAKPQPAMVSARIALRLPFTSAASKDYVDMSTIHYGKLSKSILDELQLSFTSAPGAYGAHGVCDALVKTCHEAAADPSEIASVAVSCFLPKATRYGEGASLTIRKSSSPDLTGAVMELHKLAVPCIIGVNNHERTMKQLVLVSLWLDACTSWVSETFQELEQLVVKTVEESSFETLEALSRELSERIIKYYLFSQTRGFGAAAGIRIKLEKPSAVPLADAPSIEIYRATDKDDPEVARLLVEVGKKRPVVPFPLTGRLDEFLQSWKQD